jgi:DNA processing protein
MDDRTREWIRISLIESIGENRLRNLILCVKDPFLIYEKDIEDLENLLPTYGEIFTLIRETKIDIQEYSKKLMDNGIEVLTLMDQEYPHVLRSINNPPPLLYKKGTLKKEDELAIAIVGSRASTYYGRRQAEKFSQSLVERGFTVVSGMARGIDTVAHNAAIHAGGRTMAFLGSGINVVYPKENRKLMDRIVGNGAVLTEFPLDTEPLAVNFPQRNRLISGISLGIVVIEATLRSGTFITVRWALDQGKEVFALPGDTVRKTSMGTNKLIQQGAKLIVDVEDIIEEFPFLKRRESPPPPSTESIHLSKSEKRIFESIDRSPLLVDDLIESVELPSPQILSSLLSLEMKGLIEQLPGKRYIKRGI